MPELNEQSELNKQVKSAVEDLLKADEDRLYEMIGIRSLAISEDLSLNSTFKPTVQYKAAEMGPLDDLLKIGKRMFMRLEREMYNLFCGSSVEDDEARDKLAAAFNVGATEVAAVMAILLVTHVGLSPAVAPVIAALVVKRCLKPMYGEFCLIWGERLPETDNSKN